MRQVDVLPNLLVTRCGGSSSLVRDRYHPSFVGRRAGFISDATIQRNCVTVTWLNADNRPGTSESVAVHRLVPLGGSYEPPPPETARIAWCPLDSVGLRLQGAWVFPGQRRPVEPRPKQRRRRRIKPAQLELAL